MKMIATFSLLLWSSLAAAQETMDFTTGDDEPAAASPDAMLGEAATQHELARTHRAIGQMPADEVRALFEEAIELYERFSEAFKDDPRAATAKLAKARAQRDMGDDEAALVTCSKLRDQEPAVAERAESALCAVHTAKALLEAVQAKGGSQRPTDAERAEAAERGRTLPMPDPVAKQVEAMRYFVNDHERFDPDPEVRARVVYLLADLLAAYGRKDEAAPLFERVFRWRPATDVAEAAAEELMEGPRARGDWDAYLAVIERLKAAELATPAATAAFRDKLGRSAVNAGFGRVMKLLEAERWAEAEGELAALVAADPKGPDAPRALFNRAYCLRKLGRDEEALTTYKGVIDGWPKSELVPKALLMAGQIANEKRLVDDAIALWSRFARSFPKEADAPEALLAAADLLLQDNRLPEAAELLDLHIKAYAERRAVLLARVGDLYGTMGKAKEALDRYERALKAGEGEAAERVRIAFQAGLQAERLKKAAVAKKHFEAAASLADEAGIQSEWAGRARAKVGR